jgi:signal transduction histidine kinase
MLDDGIGMADVAIAQVRDRSLDLRPPMLDDIGLAGTLEWLVKRLAAKVSLRITAQIAPLAERPAPEVESAAYRIAQEALTNVLRHAGAALAEVRLWQEGGMLFLTVRDDGAGFDPQSRQAGFGLSGMRERALLLGGEFMLDSSPGQGAEIRACLPLKPRPEP